MEKIMFKKTLLIIGLSILTTTNAYALEVKSNMCSETEGGITTVVTISHYDRLFHNKVIIGVKDIYNNRKEVSQDIVYPGKTYVVSIPNIPYEISKYYIATDKGILFEGPCND